MLHILAFIIITSATILSVDYARNDVIYVQHQVEESIFSLHGTDGRGTGWVAVTKKGYKVIVTNDHVCGNNNFMSTVTLNGERLTLPVLAKDDYHDTCILAAHKDSVPLKLASEAEENELVFSIGFPLVDFMSSLRGYVKGYEFVRFWWPETDLAQCNKPKYSIDKRTIEKYDGTKEVKDQCVFVGKVLVTTIPVDGGASGSPIINTRNEVVGMTMVRSGNLNWAKGVPINALKRFLDQHWGCNVCIRYL